jgi:hypothetical protein
MWRIIMARSRRRRSRTTGQRKYKRIFDLVCEGVKTEPEYFNWVSRNLDNDAVKLNIISKKPGESSPSALIAAAKNIDTDYKENDQLWIIMDCDHWTAKQFQEIANWNQDNLGAYCL